MKIIVITLFVIVFIGLVLMHYSKRNLKTNKPVNDYINPEEILRWKKIRQKNQSPISINVQAMGDNIEKSHDLWKSLSILVHESKWIGKSQNKIDLAAELNSLINEHKGNYLELRIIKSRIEYELIGEKN